MGIMINSATILGCAYSNPNDAMKMRVDSDDAKNLES